MDKTLDLRIQKTYKSLIDAFLQLLKEKRFENITVNEICNLAMVRRATFYKHFGDKYEFFTFLVQHFQDDFRSNLAKTDSFDSPTMPYVSIIRFLMDFLDKNELLVQSVMESSACPILMDLAAEQIVRDVKERFREDEKKGKDLPFSPDLMAQAYTGALVSITRWWIKHKDQVNKEEIIAQTAIVLEKLYEVSV